MSYINLYRPPLHLAEGIGRQLVELDSVYKEHEMSKNEKHCKLLSCPCTLKAGGAQLQPNNPLQALQAQLALFNDLEKYFQTTSRSLSIASVLHLCAVLSLCFLQAGPCAREGVSKQRSKLSLACEYSPLPPLQSMSALRSVAAAAKKLVQVQHASIPVPLNVQVSLHASLWHLKPQSGLFYGV